MVAPAEPTWTDERIETLVKLWNNGDSASEIAREFRFTRNQVIAKVHRLRNKGVELRAKPTVSVRSRKQRPATAGDGAAPKLRKQNSSPFVVVDDPGFVEPVDTTDLGPLPEEERATHFCRWPIGDPLTAGFGYCGRPQRIMPNGLRDPYCDAHRAAEHERASKNKKPAKVEDLLRSLRRHL